MVVGTGRKNEIKKSCAKYGTRFCNYAKTLRPKFTQAEGFILGVGAKMFSCCGARCAPCRRRGCVAHRPLPLARLLPPATGGSRLAPHCRTSYRLWREYQRGVWRYLLDYNFILIAEEVSCLLFWIRLGKYGFADWGISMF